MIKQQSPTSGEGPPLPGEYAQISCPTPPPLLHWASEDPQGIWQRKDHLELAGRDGSERIRASTQEQVLDVCQQLGNEFSATLQTATTPWLGFFAYDAFSAQVNRPASTELPGALADFRRYREVCIFDHRTHLLWYRNDSGQAPQFASVSAATALPPVNSKTSGNPFSIAQTPERYIDGYHRIKEYLASGDCYQVNLAHRFNMPIDSDKPGFSLLLDHPTSQAAWIGLDSGAGLRSLLCLSPERLVSCQSGNLLSQPIKGTRARSTDRKKDLALATALAQSPKDQAENLMIVDLIRNDLSRISRTGSVTVPSLFAIRQTRTLHQMESTVRSVLEDGVSLTNLLQAMMPCGSVTGAPKIRAMQIIQELEPVARGPYCGAMGWIGAGRNLDFNVAIRTARLDGGQAHIWAGGGIVADSTLLDEWLELCHKAQPLITGLSG